MLTAGHDAVKESLAASSLQLTAACMSTRYWAKGSKLPWPSRPPRPRLVCEQDLEKLIEASTIDSPVLIQEIDALDAKSGIPRQGLVRRVALDAQRIVGSRSHVLRESGRLQRLSDSTFGLNAQ